MQERAFGLEAFTFIGELDRLSTPDEIIAAMQRVLARFGFDAFIITELNLHQRFEKLVLANGWPPEFSKLYNDRNYVKVSPIARGVRQSFAPFAWDQSFYATEQDARALEVMRCAAEFGIREGFVVPIHGPQGYVGAASMAGAAVELPALARPAIHLMALSAFERARQLAAHDLNKPVITPREREVLVWAARGKSSWDIGEILRISERTVDAHLQSAFTKLGAVNRPHAVAIAISERMIDP
jgi:LuxR family quorum sensing-dependent transcriptional regulator